MIQAPNQVELLNELFVLQVSWLVALLTELFVHTALRIFSFIWYFLLSFVTLLQGCIFFTVHKI